MDKQVQEYLDKSVRFSESGELYQGLLDGSVKATRDLKHRWNVYKIQPEDIKECTILDLGCNIGGFSAFCTNHCKYYLGIDKDKDSIALAEHLYRFPNCDFQVQSILNLPKGNYDIVFAFAVRYYTHLSLKDFVFKMSTFLRPGGQLYYESHGKEKIKNQQEAFELLFSIVRMVPVLTVNNNKRHDYRFFLELIKK